MTSSVESRMRIGFIEDGSLSINLNLPERSVNASCTHSKANDVSRTDPK